jgi:hypothetical protein
LITGPEGVLAALAAERLEAPLSSLVRSDERLSAESRLDVYANAYFYRIHDVLCEDYPQLAAALGETSFHDLATSYLAVHPSEHPSLRWVGARLAPFLRESDAAAGVRARAAWAPDLAAFEWAKGLVFDALDAPIAERGDLANVPAERFEALVLAAIPAVHLLTLAWPVDALRTDASPADLAVDAAQWTPASISLVIWRRSERTFYRRADALEFEALARVRDGVRFGELCAFAASRRGDDEAPALAAAWLARWLDDGLLLPLC